MEPNATELRRRSLEPEMTGQDLQLAFFLYENPPPPNPTTASAYRETYLFVDVPDRSNDRRRQ